MWPMANSQDGMETVGVTPAIRYKLSAKSS